MKSISEINPSLSEEWKTVKFKDIFKIRKGKKVNICENPTENSIPYIVIENLRGEPIKNFSDDEKGLLCCSDDILIVWDGANCGTVGSGLDGFVGSTIARLTLIDNSIDKDYVLTFLKSNFKLFNKYTTGATIPHLDKNFLINFKIPVPPLETQKKIVETLEKAEKLKGWRAEADELADEFLKSVFLDMFGDPAINPKEWDVIKLKTVYSKNKSGTKCGPFGSALKKQEYVDSGIPVWVMDNIKEDRFIENNCLYITQEKYRQLESYSVEEGDIIISRAGTVGKMCIVHPSTSNSIISTNLIRLSLDQSKIQSIYFTSLMTYFKGRVGDLKTGEDGSYTFMNTKVLNDLEIPLPPIELQNQFAKIVKQVETLKTHQKQSKQQIDNLFNALMQKAFKGELTC